MKPHHLAWLSKHADRDEAWLKEQFAAGFHIHHLDGDHDNNEPENLMLIYGIDHLWCVHGLTRLPRKGKRGPRGPQVKRLRREFEAYWASLAMKWR